MMVIQMMLAYFLYLAKISSTDEVLFPHSFLEMATKQMYVDKTGLLIDFVKDEADEFVYLSAPRRFGKTVNNQMIKAFFSIWFEKDGYTLITDKKKHPLYKKFKIDMAHLNVIQNKKFFEEHFGNYIVVHIELGVHAIKTETDLRNLLIANIIVEFTHYKNWWLYSGSKNEIYKENIICHQILTKIFETEVNNEKDIWIWGKCLFCLFSNLEKYYEKKVILLVDEFDYSVLYTLRILGHKSADNILGFLTLVFGDPTKVVSTLTHRYPVFRALFTGVTHLPIGKGTSRLGNFKVYNYFEKHLLSEYYGFHQREVDKLLEHYNHVDKKEAVKRYYDGYTVIGAEWKNYNPLSISNFLREGGVIKSYWIQTPTVENWFQFCTDPEIFEIIELLALGKPVLLEISPAEKIIDNLKLMGEVLKICDEMQSELPVIQEYHRRYFFKYLLQEGYLSPADSSSVKTKLYVAPNEEIRYEYTRMFSKYGSWVIKLNMKGIANVFWDLANSCTVKYEHVRDIRENFHRLVQNRIKKVDNFHYNEQPLRSMIYFSCAQNTIEFDRVEFVFPEIKVEVENYINLMQPNGAVTKKRLESKTSGRADIYFKLHSGKTIMIVEVKCTTNIEKIKSQVLGYRPRKEDAAECEKLVLVWLTAPPCPSRNDEIKLQKKLENKLEVSLGCYVIENYDNSNKEQIARECTGQEITTGSKSITEPKIVKPKHGY